MSEARVQPAVALFGLLALGVAGYFAFAWSGTSLWLDEAFSVRLATASPSEAMALLREDNGPPLYYLLLSGWIALWGDGERALRAFSGLAYLATGAVLFWGARRLQGSAAAGVLAATLFWISPLAVRHALSARMYALLGLVTAASLVLFLLQLRGPEPRGAPGPDAAGAPTRAWASQRHWAAIGVNTLGLLVQYWFVFVLFAQAATYLVLWGRRGRRTVWLSWVVPLLLFAALWGWVLVDQLDSGSSAWFRPVGPEALVATFMDFYGSGISLWAFVVFPAVVLLYASGRGLALRSRAQLAAVTGGRALNGLLLICVLSVLVPWVLSLAKPIYLVGRYTLIALPPFVLWVGGALVRAVGPRIALLLVAPLLLIRILATTGDQQAWARRDQAQSSRASAQRVLSEAPANVQLVATGLGGVTLDYYLRRGERPLSLHVFPGELSSHPGWYDATRMMDQKEALRSEAEAWVASLPADAEVWHVQEEADPVAALLDEALRRARGAPVRTHALPGSFHDRVRVYEP